MFFFPLQMHVIIYQLWVELICNLAITYGYIIHLCDSYITGPEAVSLEFAASLATGLVSYMLLY